MSESRTHRLRLLAVASVCLSFFAVRQAAADEDPGAAARRLAQASVPVDDRNHPGVTHEFPGLGAIVPDAKAAVAQAVRGLTQSFRTAAR